MPGAAPESRPVFRFHVQHPARSRVGGQSVVSLGPMIRETARDANSEAIFRGRRLAGSPRLDAHSHPGAGPSTQESGQQPELAEQDESVEEPMFHVQPSRERRPFGRGHHSFAWPRLGPAGTTDRLHDRPTIHWCSGRRGGGRCIAAPGRAPRRASDQFKRLSRRRPGQPPHPPSGRPVTRVKTGVLWTGATDRPWPGGEGRTVA